MEEQEVRITLRLPQGLRDRLTVASEANKRSMNAEIVWRIQDSFDGPHVGERNQKALMEALLREMEKHEFNIRRLSDEELRIELARRGAGEQ